MASRFFFYCVLKLSPFQTVVALTCSAAAHKPRRMFLLKKRKKKKKAHLLISTLITVLKSRESLQVFSEMVFLHPPHPRVNCSWSTSSGSDCSERIQGMLSRPDPAVRSPQGCHHRQTVAPAAPAPLHPQAMRPQPSPPARPSSASLRPANTAATPKQPQAPLEVLAQPYK